MISRRVWGPIETFEGEPYAIVGYLVGLDGTTPLNNTGSGQGGVTNLEWKVYRVSGPNQNTLIYTATLDDSRVLSATPQTGTGYSSFAKGWNFRLAVPGGSSELFTALGGWQLRHEFTLHGTGVTADPGLSSNPVTWDPMTLDVLHNVLPRRGA